MNPEWQDQAIVTITTLDSCTRRNDDTAQPSKQQPTIVDIAEHQQVISQPIMVNPKRKKQISEQVQRELASVILQLNSAPLLKKATIMHAEVSPDLSVAKIFFSVFDPNEAEATTEIFKSKSGELRYALAHSLNLRKTPRLIFIYDDTMIKAQKLSALIDQALEDDKKFIQPHDDSQAPKD